MVTDFWVLVWNTRIGDVSDRLGPYNSYEEAWEALEDEVRDMEREGWECERANSDIDGYFCRKRCVMDGEEYTEEYWLTVEERLRGLPK